MFEPSALDERISLWNYYYMNVRHPKGIVDRRLVELGMFHSCDNFVSSESDSSGGL